MVLARSTLLAIAACISLSSAQGSATRSQTVQPTGAANQSVYFDADGIAHSKEGVDGQGNYTFDADYDQNKTFGYFQLPESASTGVSGNNNLSTVGSSQMVGDSRDNCKGSLGCSSWDIFSFHKPTAADCMAAADRFDDREFYEKQACTHNHCTAIYECDNINYWPPLYLRGVIIKDEFNLILNKKAGLGCTNCGSRYFGDPMNITAPARCRVTFNYCNWKCAEGPGKCSSEFQGGISEDLAAQREGVFNGTITNSTILAYYGFNETHRPLNASAASAGLVTVVTPTSRPVSITPRPLIQTVTDIPTS